MPAIDPERLERQIAEVLSARGDPTALTRASIDLFEFYADRARRTSGASRPGPPVSGFGVPRPVVRGLAGALRQAFTAQPEEALVFAASLWERDCRECRLMAVALLGDVASDEAANWAEPRAAACDDFNVLSELATTGLVRWRETQREAFLDRTARWLRAGPERLRCFALLSLAAAATDPGFEDLPTVFRLLATASLPSRGLVRRSLVQLLRALARRSPQETARYLLDILRLQQAEAETLIRQLLPVFPPHQHEILRQALMDHRRPGIMSSLVD